MLRNPLPALSLPALLLLCGLSPVLSTPVRADSFFFSTGDPDGKMAMASRPASAGGIEIEAADDFVLQDETQIDHATFTGLLPVGVAASDVSEVRLEIYRVFPTDSDTVRTPNVPTRVNSPSDVAFDARDSAAATLSFTTSLLGSFSALNSVLNGIHPKPNQLTGGEGPVTGQEAAFDVTIGSPFDLPAGHYFFVPQVLLDSGNFFWLSAPKPIVPPGTPFPSGFSDLQAWIRNEDLAPDWLRVGQDIVGGNPFPTFNGTFSLEGTVVPEPSGGLLLASGIVGIGLRRRRA
jgi:hypothetical protein